MSGGSLVTQFLDLDKFTTEANISGGKFVYAAQRDQKYVVPRFASGDLGAPKMVDAGKEISFNTVLSARSTFQPYRFGQSGSGINTNHGVKGRLPWSSYRANKMYEDAEILLDPDVITGQRIGGKKGLDFIVAGFARIRDLKNAPFMEDMAHGWEGTFWAKPRKSVMEIGDLTADATVEATPIMAIVNGEANGLWGVGLTGETWTKKQNIDPTLAEYNGNYTPRQRTYDNFTVNSAVNVLHGFDDISKDLTWETPGKFGEYYQNEEMKKRMIISSRRGVKEIQALYRASQNFFSYASNDASIPDPHYLNIPITWNDSFGAGLYYPLSGTATGSETTATVTGPRYLWLEGNNIKPVIHPQRFFQQAAPANDATNRPEVWIVWATVWQQFVYPDIRKHGIVSPRISV